LRALGVTLTGQRLCVTICKRGKEALRLFVAAGGQKSKRRHRRHPLAGYAARLSRELVSTIRNPRFRKQIARDAKKLFGFAGRQCHREDSFATALLLTSRRLWDCYGWSGPRLRRASLAATSSSGRSKPVAVRQKLARV